MPIDGIESRVSLVTGASRGIGRAVAEALSARGSKVALVARDQRRLDEAVAAIVAGGGTASAFSCDVTDEASIHALRDQVTASLGPVEILVNNAGAAQSVPFTRETSDGFRQALAINLTSVFLVTHAFLPGMLERGHGRVIQVASTAGKVGHAYVSSYCAAKHGVIGLTRALALEVARKGVTVNAICPSYVDTEMTEASIRNIADKTGRSLEEARESLLATNPQHRLVEVDEVAAMAVYLASDAARGVTGQAWNICGGATPV